VVAIGFNREGVVAEIRELTDADGGRLQMVSPARRRCRATTGR